MLKPKTQQTSLTLSNRKIQIFYPNRHLKSRHLHIHGTTKIFSGQKNSFLKAKKKNTTIALVQGMSLKVFKMREVLLRSQESLTFRQDIRSPALKSLNQITCQMILLSSVTSLQIITMIHLCLASIILPPKARVAIAPTILQTLTATVSQEQSWAYLLRASLN